ncbi:MAG: MBL fold metallo-hydrolase [Phototrophicaceae bacterium]
MSLKIKVLCLGIAQTNTYLIADTDTQEAILIDPVDEPHTLFAMASEEGWQIKRILATHAHFDHVLASKGLVELTGAPFYIHQEAAPFLANLPETGLRFVGSRFPAAAEPTHLLTANEVVQLGAIQLKALYTPGHAPGHLSFLMEREQVVFSGDSLFAGTIGRTDLPNANLATLLESIRTQLFTLPDSVTVLPGHGRPTTIGQERQTNPYLVLSSE